MLLDFYYLPILIKFKTQSGWIDEKFILNIYHCFISHFI